MADYEIATYRAGHWAWTVRKDGTLLEFGGYCLTRRKALKKARQAVEDILERGGRSKEDLKAEAVKAKTMRKETYHV